MGFGGVEVGSSWSGSTGIYGGGDLASGIQGAFGLPTMADVGGPINNLTPAQAATYCSKPIMQQEYIGYYKQMGKDLNVKPEFIMTSSLQESGWDLSHVYGTNSSSNGKPLNNLFGAAPNGGNNKAYPNVWASATDWEKTWGPVLTDNPQTIDAYVKDLNSRPKKMYNSHKSYPGDMSAAFSTLQSVLSACNVSLSGAK